MLYGKEFNTIRMIPWNRRHEDAPDNTKCLAEEAFKAQMSKPPWLRSKSVLVACRCPKCRVIG